MTPSAKSFSFPVCLDAETWLYLWELNPRDDRERLFEALASKLDHEGVLVPEEVSREIMAKNEGLHEWLKSNCESVISLSSEIESAVSDLLSRFPMLVDPDQIGFQSDVFLLATALHTRASIISIRKGWKSVIDRYDIDRICAEGGIDLRALPSFDTLLKALEA